MKTNAVNGMVVMFSIAWLLGCAVGIPEIPAESLDPSLEFAYIKDDSALFLMNGDGSSGKEIFSVPGRIISPSWSPDGQNIAFFEIKKTTALLTSPEVWLGFFDMNEKKKNLLIEFSPEVERKADGEKSYQVKPPLWIDNNRLIVLDKKGLHSVNIAKAKSEVIVESKNINDYVITNQSTKILFSQGGTLKTYDLINRETHSFFTENEGHIQGKEIECIGISRSEKRIALSGWDYLFLVDYNRQKVLKELKLPGPIRDLIWGADERQLVCLTGVPTRRIGEPSVVNPAGATSGSFHVSSFSDNEEEMSVLFKKLNFDVRDTWISFSPNGRWILLISSDLNTRSRNIYVLEYGGEGMKKLTTEGGCSYPVWRP